MKKINGKAHWEAAKGNWEQNYKYCTKDGSYVEYGSKTTGKGSKRKAIEEPTTRDELTDCIKRFKQGESLTSVMEEYPDHIFALEKIHSHMDPPQRKKPYVLYLWGPTGTGKTTNTQLACEECNQSVFWKDNTKWWLGYANQQVTVLEEFSSIMTCTQFLRLCDDTPFKVEYKGGSHWFTSEVIIVLSNTPPELQYISVKDSHPERWEAYYRRVIARSINTRDMTYNDIRHVVKEALQYSSYINSSCALPA